MTTNANQNTIATDLTANYTMTTNANGFKNVIDSMGNYATMMIANQKSMKNNNAMNLSATAKRWGNYNATNGARNSTANLDIEFNEFVLDLEEENEFNHEIRMDFWKKKIILWD